MFAIFKKRKGSILLVIVYGFVMAVVMLGFMKLGQALSTGSKDSAQVYCDIQTYRSASELICYQYLTALESAVIQKDLDSDWLSVTNRAIYTQAIEAILDYYNDPEYNDTGYSWVQHDAVDALNSLNITNKDFVGALQSKLNEGYQKFTLTVPEPLIVDPLSDASFEQVRKAYMELKPFQIEVSLRCKGETLVDTYIVSDMFLLVQSENTYEADGSIHMIVTLSFVEAEEGCKINRATD